MSLLRAPSLPMLSPTSTSLLTDTAAHAGLVLFVPLTVRNLLPASYLDLEYAWWQVWLLWPMLALLVIPLSLAVFLFMSAFFVECYRHW